MYHYILYTHLIIHTYICNSEPHVDEQQVIVKIFILTVSLLAAVAFFLVSMNIRRFAPAFLLAANSYLVEVANVWTNEVIVN